MIRPRFERVVVMAKTSLLERVRKGAMPVPSRFYDEPTVNSSHKANSHALVEVLESLRKYTSQVVVLETLTPSDVDWADLVVSVGGDGTFLSASHSISGNTPILAVNSDPESSYGYFCSAVASNCSQVIERYVEGEIPLSKLQRICIEINGVLHPQRVMNDVLIAGELSGDMARYTLKESGKTEQYQKSSGVWVCTAAGSSAAMLSAGGVLMPLDSQLLQYRVRELFPPSLTNEQEPLMAGLTSSLEVVSKMTDARIFLDGRFASVPVQWGDHIKVRRSNRPLTWVCSPECVSHRQNLLEAHSSLRSRLGDVQKNVETQVLHEKHE